MHEVKPLVDIIQRHGVGDHRIDVDLAVHVPVNDLRNIRAPACATDCGATPDPASDKLKGTRADFGARRGHADDDALSPPLVGGLKCGAHNTNVACRIEGIVRATASQFDQMRHQIAIDVVGVDEIRHTEPVGHLFLSGIEVDPHNLIRASKPQTLNDIEPDTPQPEHDSAAADLDLGSVNHRADSGGDPATNVANLV